MQATNPAHTGTHSGVGCEPLLMRIFCLCKGVSSEPCTYTESAPVITSDRILHWLAVYGVGGGPP